MTVPKGKPSDVHPDVIARQLGLSPMGRGKALSRDELLNLACAAFWRNRDAAMAAAKAAL